MTDIATIVRLLVILLLIALTVIFITRRLTVPYTLGLVVVGLLIGIFGHVSGVRLTPDLVLFVFLPALLFEGSWSIQIERLRKNWLVIFLLAVPGLLLSLVLIALLLHFFAGLIWVDAFLLAAILSPTDPVAVLGLFRQLKVDEDLSTIIEGESLFNDGVAGSLYQVFLAFVLIFVHRQAMTTGQILTLGLETLLLEAGGGVLIGSIAGFLISRFVKFIDDPLIETTITIVTAYGVYLLADSLHASGILAVIMAGLILGSYGQRMGMSARTRDFVDDFWSIVAFVVNALLFLLVGVQLNPTSFLASGEALHLLLVAGLSIIAVLLARFIMVLLLPRRLASFPGLRLRSWRFTIFWSGLRGALSLALVLALPLEVPDRSSLIFSTYAVVLFTLLVQGISLRWIVKRLPSVGVISSS
ncbi:MAG TPA: cation:proton antiporter [Ktedonobacteraceae bacterium]|nr:cation:proton antiporter [Ktedonobacteraceae bacterium]